MKLVNVLYKFVDGAHFFVAGDEESVGLCVAHEDVEIAFDAVEGELTKLCKLNHGIDATFEPSLSAMEFAAMIKKQQQELADSGMAPAAQPTWAPKHDELCD